MTHDEAIAVINAAKEDQQIECRQKGVNTEWKRMLLGASRECLFQFGSCDYRVKSEPREFWVNVYTDGVDDRLWRCREAAWQAREIGREIGRPEPQTLHLREVLEGEQ